MQLTSLVCLILQILGVTEIEAPLLDGHHVYKWDLTRSDKRHVLEVQVDGKYTLIHLGKIDEGDFQRCQDAVKRLWFQKRWGYSAAYPDLTGRGVSNDGAGVLKLKKGKPAYVWNVA